MSPERPRPPDVGWVAVGRVTRAHGVKGEVAVLPLTEVGSRFVPGSRLFTARGERALSVASSRSHGHRLLVRFEDVPDRDAAGALHGAYLFVPASETPALPEGEYWPHQLIGCEMVTESGRSLGSLREVMRTQANDIWAAEGADGETLVPALRDVVVSVDLPARRVVVRDIPGLTAP